MFIDSVNIINMDIVNMTKAKTAYHHGNLRSQLVEAAVACIEADGASKLSLRKVAGQLGVSHNAPYMHFQNKDALLDAVIDHGFTELQAAIAQAGGQQTLTSDDWKQRVKSGFRAYIAFAKDNPGLYALMHLPKRTKPKKPTGSSGDDTGRAGAATLERLAETLKTGQQLQQVRPGDTSEMALWVWATLHGLSSLTAENRLAFKKRPPDLVAETVLDQLMEALSG